MSKKLFCFPNAGGTSMVFQKWSSLMEDIEICPVELPGRGRRAYEPLLESMDLIVEDAYLNVIAKLDDTTESYYLFGHSMGGLLVYELLKKLENQKMPLPAMAFISGAGSPESRNTDKKLRYLLSDHELIEEVVAIGGTPKELFENQELSKIFLPVIRADYKAIETYRHVKTDVKLDVPVSLMMAVNDPCVEGVAEDWFPYLMRKPAVVFFEGGHFYLHEKVEETVSYIRESIKKLESINKE